MEIWKYPISLCENESGYTYNSNIHLSFAPLTQYILKEQEGEGRATETLAVISLHNNFAWMLFSAHMVNNKSQLPFFFYENEKHITKKLCVHCSPNNIHLQL